MPNMGDPKWTLEEESGTLADVFGKPEPAPDAPRREIVIRADPFYESPASRRVAAKLTLERAMLGDSDDHRLERIEPTEGEQLSCTAPPIQYGPRPDLAKRISDKVGTAYGVTLERSMQMRATNITARCCSCAKALWTWRDDDAPYTLEDRADFLAWSILRCREPEMHEDGDCMCVDGLTPQQCLERWQIWQREDFGWCARNPGRAFVLTARQKETARAQWSAELRKRCEEKKPEAATITMQDQWGDE